MHLDLRGELRRRTGAYRVTQADWANMCIGRCTILVFASAKSLGLGAELDMALNANHSLIGSLQAFILS
jgi:hypothetical protein